MKEVENKMTCKRMKNVDNKEEIGSIKEELKRGVRIKKNQDFLPVCII